MGQDDTHFFRRWHKRYKPGVPEQHRRSNPVNCRRYIRLKDANQCVFVCYEESTSIAHNRIVEAKLRKVNVKHYICRLLMSSFGASKWKSFTGCTVSFFFGTFATSLTKENRNLLHCCFMKEEKYLHTVGILILAEIYIQIEVLQHSYLLRDDTLFQTAPNKMLLESFWRQTYLQLWP